MSFISIDFNSVDETSQGGSFVLEEGDYNVFVVRSEDKKTSTGSLQVSLFLEVADGPFAGKRTWVNLVYANSHGSTVSSKGGMLLGAVNLKRIAIACGVDLSRGGLDLDLLTNKPFVARLTKSKTDTGKERNELNNVPGFDKTVAALRLAQARAAHSTSGAAVPTYAPAAPVAAASAAPAAPAPQGGAADGIPSAW